MYSSDGTFLLHGICLSRLDSGGGQEVPFLYSAQENVLKFDIKLL